MSFIINFENTSGDKGTVIPDLDFNYTDKLNDLNEGKVNISGTSELKKTLIEEGSTIEIKRNGTIEFAGEVVGISYLDGGGVSARCNGSEFKMSKDNGDYSGSTWKNTASKTIYEAVINEFDSSSLGTVETGVDLDFKALETSSYLNVVKNLQSKTSQDRSINYTTSPFQISILDHKGSSTSVETLNDGIGFTNLQVDRSLPKGNKILVYGKGDGENQIKSEYPSHGQNSTSQTKWDVITWVERDPTIVSIDEANKLADVLAAAYGVKSKTYRFDLINPSKDYVSGDVITLNSRAKDLANEEVRIVGIEKGIRSRQEYMTLQVTSKEYSRLLKTRDILLGEIQRNSRDEQTYMQGTTNILTFSEMINANSTAPLRVKAYLPESFIKDEVGNLRVNSFTLDYDVDPFRSGVGTASETSVAPSLSGGETDSHKHDASDSGHDHTNSTQTTTANWIGESEGTDTGSSVSCSSGSWTKVVSEYVGTASNTSVDFYIRGDSGGAEDISIRVRNSGFSHTTDADCQFGIYIDGFRDVSFFQIQDIAGGPCSSDTISVDVYPHTGAIDVDGYLGVYEKAHTHSISSWDVSDENASVSDSNKTPGLSGNAASHNHSVSIGDGISDASSLNSTQVNIYLDFWSGSAWVNKHSILNTGKTIDYDVDISNGGTYPDAPGFWRTRILTNSANADLVQGTIKCVHELDS